MTSIVYQNKDITQKLSAELLKDKSLAVYGLPHIKIKELLPTNLPAIEANELRLDNLFLLEDGSLALIDYESSFDKDDIVKYVNYIARILKRSRMNGFKTFPVIHLVIIFSADIAYIEPLIMDIGCMKLWLEPAFLSNIPTDFVYEQLKAKIHKKMPLSSEDLLQLIILPLTVQGKENQQSMIPKVVELADNLIIAQQRVQALSAIVTFSDKIIDSAYANHVKELIRMNKVTMLFMEEGALAKLLSQIRKKIARGWNVQSISDLLEEDEAYVKKLVDLIQNNPDKDDTAICKIIFDEKYPMK